MCCWVLVFFLYINNCVRSAGLAFCYKQQRFMGYVHQLADQMFPTASVLSKTFQVIGFYGARLHHCVTVEGPFGCGVCDDNSL